MFLSIERSHFPTLRPVVPRPSAPSAPLPNPVSLQTAPAHHHNSITQTRPFAPFTSTTINTPFFNLPYQESIVVSI